MIYDDKIIQVMRNFLLFMGFKIEENLMIYEARFFKNCGYCKGFNF